MPAGPRRNRRYSSSWAWITLIHQSEPTTAHRLWFSSRW
jgi:hypothetical protein